MEFERITAFIQKTPEVKLLQNPELVRWLLLDTEFLGSNKKELLEKEKTWCLQVLRGHRPLGGTFGKEVGEAVCKELALLHGAVAWSPKCIQGLLPDLETNDCIIESKSQGIFMTGTADEKILGVPSKYADVPALYGKPVVIVCLGGAEIKMRKYGFIGETQSAAKRRQIEFNKEQGFTFVGASQILRELVS